MRPPPSLAELPRFPIVGGTALLAIGATFAFLKNKQADPELMAPLMEDAHILLGEYWRLVTSILLHGDWLHLLFNVYWLWVLGSAVEDRYGPFPTLGVVLVLAVGSGAAEYAVFRGGIGLSGVGYGLFAMIWVLARTGREFEDVIDRRTAVIFVAWFFLCIVLDVTGAMPIANVAHGVGAALGALFGLAVGSRRWRWPAAAGLAVLVVAFTAAAIRFRPVVNFSRDRGKDELWLGYRFYEARDYGKALTMWEQASRLRPADPDCRQKVAAALHALGREEEGNRAMAEAVALRAVQAERQQ